MKTKTKPGTLEWLKDTALFGCHVCEEECSWTASELRWIGDEPRLICDNCHDFIDDPPMKDGDVIPWSQLPIFDPFAFATVDLEHSKTVLAEVGSEGVRKGQEAMLEEVKALRDKHRGIWGMFSKALDALPIQEPTEQAK